MKEFIKKHRKAIISGVAAVCIILLVWWLIPFSGELNGADFLFGYTVYIEEGYTYTKADESSELHDVWKLDKATAKEIYDLLKTAEKIADDADVYDGTPLSNAESSEIQMEPVVYIHAGNRGYMIEVTHVGSQNGDIPMLRIKRTKASGKLEGAEAVQAIINGQEKSVSEYRYSMMPTEELFEFLDIVRGYDGAGGELIAEDTNQWRLSEFG